LIVTGFGLAWLASLPTSDLSIGQSPCDLAFAWPVQRKPLPTPLGCGRERRYDARLSLDPNLEKNP
jgi:hypothetical protein